MASDRPRLRPWAVLDVAAVAALTYYIGWRIGAFRGFPKGYDALGHLGKARYIAAHWPHVNWNDAWYAGQPAFQGSYPPGYHVLVAGVSALAHQALPTAMVTVAAAAMIAVVAGLQVTVYALTASRPAALVAALLLLATPTLWDQEVELGLYPRFVAFGFVSLAVAGAALRHRFGRRASAIATVVLLSAALTTHPVVGLLGMTLCGITLIAAPDPPWPRRLRDAAGIPLAAVALSGYFYLPLVLVNRGQSMVTDYEQPLPLSTLVWPWHGDLAALSPVLVPATLAAVAAAFVFLRRPRVRIDDLHRLGPAMTLLVTRPQPGQPLPADLPGDVTASVRAKLAAHWRRADRWRRRRPTLIVAAACLALSVCVIGYGVIGYVMPHFPFYVNGLQPRDLLVYPGWLLSAAITLVLHCVTAEWRPLRWRVVARVVAAGVAVAALAAAIPVLPRGVRDDNNAALAAMESLLPRDSLNRHDLRIAATTDLTSRWVTAYTDTPQVRGYDDHGNLHPGWQFWLDSALTSPAYSPAQRAWMLRWWSVGWVLTQGTGSAKVPVTTGHVVTPIGSQQIANVSAWQVPNPTPITTAVHAPTVLVIGDDAHYDSFLRALALSDVDERTLVPVHGPASLDAVSPAQLQTFDAVVLYGASGDPARANALLTPYVRAGGGLYVEGADGPLDRALSGGVVPVRSTRDITLSSRWALPATPSPLDVHDGEWATTGADWGVRTGDATAPWAYPVLGDSGAVAIAAGRYGAGHVVWSGLNLPYHATARKAADESRWLGSMLATIARPHAPSGSAKEQWLDPDHRVIRTTAGARAVLVHELTSADWHATVDGHPATIWKAGPDMTLVMLPPGAHVVRLFYRLGPAEMLGVGLSALTVLVLLGAAIGGPVGRWRSRVARRWASRVADRLGAGPLVVPQVLAPDDSALADRPVCGVGTDASTTGRELV